MSQSLQIPTSKQKRDGEINFLSNGLCIEVRGNYTREEILDKVRSVVEEETPYSVEYWLTHGRYSQAWYKIVPDGSGEWTWVSIGKDTPCRGSYFASVLSLY